MAVANGRVQLKDLLIRSRQKKRPDGMDLTCGIFEEGGGGGGGEGIQFKPSSRHGPNFARVGDRDRMQE